MALAALAARAFPVAPSTSLERAPDGVSSHVYRLRRRGATFYLRLAETPEASLGPEAHAHALARARGVRAPEVVYYEPRDPVLGLSAMVTTEIPGAPLAHTAPGEDIRGILEEAGRDLALLGGVPVEGFGWVRRDRPEGAVLAGEMETHREFVAEHTAALVSLGAAGELDTGEMRATDRILATHDGRLDVPAARLAHGDLDTTHIYHDGGRYTGIIDFGEIRGTDPLYDLGHFRAHDGEHVPYPLLPWLLEGYGQVAPLPPDAERRIALLSLLIAARTLARHLALGREGAYVEHLRRSVRREIAALRPHLP